MYELERIEENVENNINSTNLQYIKIKGLFGRHDIMLDFDKEVNIYIGENGLGKTTILNCVYFILKKQYLKLAEIDFDEIAIKFSNIKTEKKIKLADINAYNKSRMPKRGYYDAEYMDYIFQDIALNPISLDEFGVETLEFLTRRVQNMTGMPPSMARRHVYQYINERSHPNNQNTNGNEENVIELSNLIEKHIKQKIHYFTTYRRIEDDFSKLLSNEEKMRESSDILIRFGMEDVVRSINEKLGKIGENSREGFNKMTGVLLKQYSESNSIPVYPIKDKYNIDKEMLKIILDRLGNEVDQEDRDKIIAMLEDGRIFKSEYYYLFDLISKLIDNYEKQKIFDEKIKNFASTCNKYLNKKRFVYNQSELTLSVYLENEDESIGNTIELTNLSSGEKQIVSLFSKLYLDNEQDCILVIDEPELSLSIQWQKMLLPDIMRSGSCKLLLTVTHSPFIFSNEFDIYAKEIHTCIK